MSNIMTKIKPELSVVVPLYNEADGLAEFHKNLLRELKKLSLSYEIIYVDDGSNDQTPQKLAEFHKHNASVRVTRLSRNFGKENALTAGLAQALGQANIMIDGDGQHPPEKIKEFIDKWRAGAQVVIGVRTGTSPEALLKRAASGSFYKLLNRLTGRQLIAGSTDFRLIDKAVLAAFLDLKESDRITRGLIDWLGFKRELVYFEARPRRRGKAVYDRHKRMILAANSFVSLSPKPLYIFGYVGIFITLTALLMGLAILLEQVILGDPLDWDFTGTAMLGILIWFLVGLVLVSQGMLSLYVSHIHSQSKRRPLYVIDKARSLGLKSNDR